MTGGTLSCEHRKEIVMFQSETLKKTQICVRTGEYLKEWRGIQQSSISTKTNDEVYTIGEVIKIWARSQTERCLTFRLRWTPCWLNVRAAGMVHTFSESAKLLSNSSKVLISCNGWIIQNFLFHVNDHVFHLQRHTTRHELDRRTCTSHEVGNGAANACENWSVNRKDPLSSFRLNACRSPWATCRTSVRKMQSSLKGWSRLESRIFLMTRTLFGGLFHVSLWLAGSWMCLKKTKPHKTNFREAQTVSQEITRIKKELSWHKSC